MTRRPGQPQRGQRTGRSLRVLLWLQTQTTPRTGRQIHTAVDPHCDMNLMSGTLSTLERNLKLITTRVDGRLGFTIAADAMINRRTGRRIDVERPPSIKAQARARAQAKAAAQQAATATAASTRTRNAVHSATVASPSAAKRMDPLHLADSPHHKATAAELIASDVQRFEKAGGRIEKLANGVVSRPLLMTARHAMTAQSAAATELKTARTRRAAAAPALS